MATQPDNFLEKKYSLLKETRVIIVSTSWNKEINQALVKGANEIFAPYHQIKTQELEVPGAVELAFIIKEHYTKYRADAYIAFGCVIRGGTPHFEYVCEAANNAITQLNISLSSPVIFGVLTLENQEQAWERLGGKHGHKGKEAAQTVLAMLELKQNL